MTTVKTQNPVSQSLLDSVNKKSTSGTSTDEAQDRFMTLLVTQMKNQDPLNPMDNAQVTSQMAQLNTVTGINKLNENMSGFINSMQLGQSYQAANMIGRSVLVPGNSISHTTSGGPFGINLPSGADDVTINIKNGAGLTIRTLSMGQTAPGTTGNTWDGKTNDGSTAPSGNYTFEVEAKLSTSKVSSTALSLAKVESVSNSNGGIKLNLSNNSTVSTSDVVEIF